MNTIKLLSIALIFVCCNVLGMNKNNVSITYFNKEVGSINPKNDQSVNEFFEDCTHERDPISELRGLCGMNIDYTAASSEELKKTITLLDKQKNDLTLTVRAIKLFMDQKNKLIEKIERDIQENEDQRSMISTIGLVSNAALVYYYDPYQIRTWIYGGFSLFTTMHHIKLYINDCDYKNTIKKHEKELDLIKKICRNINSTLILIDQQKEKTINASLNLVMPPLN